MPEDRNLYRLDLVSDDLLPPGRYAMQDWTQPRRLVEVELLAPLPRSVLTSISGPAPTIIEFAHHPV